MMSTSAEWAAAEAAWATAVATGIMALTGIIALIYASRQLSQSRETAKVQHLLRFVEQFESEPLATARKSLAQKKVERDEHPPELDVVLNFFETIGLLVRRGYLDADDVWDCFSYWMFNVYADSRGVIEQEQKADASFYRDFSTLIEKLRVIEQDRGCDLYPPSKVDIEEFWKYEQRIAPGKAARYRRKQNVAKESDSAT